jgi:hypothetical protein
MLQLPDGQQNDAQRELHHYGADGPAYHDEGRGRLQDLCQLPAVEHQANADASQGEGYADDGALIDAHLFHQGPFIDAEAEDVRPNRKVDDRSHMRFPRSSALAFFGCRKAGSITVNWKASIGISIGNFHPAARGSGGWVGFSPRNPFLPCR